MEHPTHIERFGDIAPRYDAALCDAWGVIHNGRRLFDGVEAAMTAFRRERGPIVILTNAPKPSSLIPGQLDRLGLSRDAYDAVVTSGDVTRAAIARMGDRAAHAIGAAFDEVLFAGLDIDFAPLAAAGYIICTGLAEAGPSEPEDYRAVLADAAARRLPMICANPDIVVRWGDALVWCAGAIARVYEDLGGPVIYAGKPHGPIYELAFDALADARRTGASDERAAPARERTLAIGDGPATDIKGASDHGLDALFIYGSGGVNDGDGDAVAIAQRLAQADARARYAMRGLVW